jgi:hypothetical protein
VLAAEHGLPIVPIHIAGTHQAMPPGRRWMSRRGGRLLGRRHPVVIRFGAPIHVLDGEHRADVMERVRRFFAASGAVTAPPAPRPAVGEKLPPAGVQRFTRPLAPGSPAAVPAPHEQPVTVRP